MPVRPESDVCLYANFLNVSAYMASTTYIAPKPQRPHRNYNFSSIIGLSYISIR